MSAAAAHDDDADSVAIPAISRDSGDYGDSVDLPAAFWRPLPAKLRAYQAVYWLNRCLQAALVSLERLERLERLGMFRLEFLNQYKIQIEHTRAQANEELTETLNRQEADDSFRFDSMQHEYEKRYRDPDDVFFQAQDRRREIKDQIRELQKGLERQRPRRRSRSARKKPKRAGK